MVVMTIMNSTLGSALPSNAVPYIMEEFRIDSETQKYLPISVYLIGESRRWKERERKVISMAVAESLNPC